MQKRRLKNSKKNISETWKMWCNKNARKRCSNEKSCQEDSQQERYTDGRINGTTKNIGVGWRETGDDGRAKDLQEKGQ